MKVETIDIFREQIHGLKNQFPVFFTETKTKQIDMNKDDKVHDTSVTL